MLNNFKYAEGDIVKCISITSDNYESLVVGNIYAVVGATSVHGDVIYAVIDSDDKLHHSIDRFELVLPNCNDVTAKPSKFDIVSKPMHYNRGKYEVIDVIEDATSEMVGIEAVCVGNILKYVMRYRYKNGVQDLQKAKYYLDKLISKLENSNHEL